MKSLFKKIFSITLAAILTISVIPVLSTNVEAAGNIKYNSITLDIVPIGMQEVSGCGISSTSMVVGAHFNYSEQDMISVYNAVKELNSGSLRLIFKNLGMTACKKDLQTFYDSLAEGNPVLVYRARGPHWSVIYGYNGSATTLEGKGFQVADPRRDPSSVKYLSYDEWIAGSYITSAYIITDFSVYFSSLCAHDWHGKNENGEYVVRCSTCKEEYKVKEVSQNNSYKMKAAVKAYNAPYSNSTVKTTLRVNDTIEVVASTVNAYGNTWFKLKDGSWVYYGKYVGGKLTDNKFVVEKPIDKTVASNSKKKPSYTAYIQASIEAVVYKEPSSSNEVGRIAHGETCTVNPNKNSGSWIYVEYGNAKGYVYSDYISQQIPPTIRIDKTSITPKGKVKVSWDEYANAVAYDVYVKYNKIGEDKNVFHKTATVTKTYYEFSKPAKGDYVIFVSPKAELDGFVYASACPSNPVSFRCSDVIENTAHQISLGAPKKIDVEPVSQTVINPISTSAATEITASSAKLNGALKSDKKVHVTEHGVYLGTSIDGMSCVAKDSVDKTVSSLTMFYSTEKYGVSLKPDTTYYFYQYAVIDGTVFEGQISSFKTQPGKQTITVSTNAATEITATSAKLNGSLSADKNVHITEHGAYLGTSPSNMKRVARDSVDKTVSSLTMFYSTSKYGTTLQPNTTYYFCEYAVIDGDFYEGDTLSFTTPPEDSKPVSISVSTNAATNITQTSAQLNGSLSASDKVHITEHGAYLGTSPSNMKRVARDSVDKTVSSLTMFYSTSKYGTTLQPNTTYYFCEYAVIDGDFYEGDTLSFTTPPEDSKPVSISVSTNAATNITQTSAQLNGSLSASDKVHVTEHGAYLGTSPSNMKRVARDSVDKNVSSLTMFYSTSKYGTTLQPNTTYYFCEYAVIDGDFYEGDTLSFTTPPEDSKPVSISVSTNAATNITQTSAQLNGSLSASDKVHVTEHGAYLGTSTSNMTRVAKDSVDKNVSSLTMFYSTSKYGTTLKAGTTYYFYQYAVIEGVTYEGNIVSFTTAAETKTENTRKGVVTSDGYLAINDKPAASPANSTKIGRIPSGAAVTVYPDKTSGNWYWVSYDGVSGYAYSKYIKLQ